MKNIFKKKSNELEELIVNFLKGDGYKEFAEEQARQQQQHYWRLKEVERQKNIKEKYEYLKFRKENNLEITESDQREYEFVSYICEKDQK